MDSADTASSSVVSIAIPSIGRLVRQVHTLSPRCLRDFLHGKLKMAQSMQVLRIALASAKIPCSGC